MTDWNVVPSGVQKVLDDVDAAATPVAAALQALSVQLSAAVNGTQSAEVSTAMETFVAEQSVDLTMIQNRIPAAKDAVVVATNAVTAGDEEMATALQTQAAAVWAEEG